MAQNSLGPVCPVPLTVRGIARCAVRVATNGSDGDLEGLARALRALAFDAKTARVYDAVVHVLPDAAKVLGAVAKLA